MDELIQQVIARTGITEAQARGAIETVAEFAKSKLPPAFAGQVDSFLSGNTDPNAGDPTGGLLNTLGGFFNS